MSELGYAYEKVNEVDKDGKPLTTFTWVVKNKKRYLEVQNAQIIWNNFSGSKGKYNAEGNRVATLVLTDDVYETLKAAGYNVIMKDISEIDPETRNDPEPKKIKVGEAPTIKIKININSQEPPVVRVCSTFRGKKTNKLLEGTLIGELDRLDITRWDIMLSSWFNAETGTRSFYLNTLFCQQRVADVFEGLYNEFIDNDDEPTENPAFDVEEEDN